MSASIDPLDEHLLEIAWPVVQAYLERVHAPVELIRSAPAVVRQLMAVGAARRTRDDASTEHAQWTLDARAIAAALAPCTGWKDAGGAVYDAAEVAGFAAKLADALAAERTRRRPEVALERAATEKVDDLLRSSGAIADSRPTIRDDLDAHLRDL